MKLTLQPTSAIVTMLNGDAARIWEGDADGTPVAALILTIGVEAPNVLPELVEVPPPKLVTLQMFEVDPF